LNLKGEKMAKKTEYTYRQRTHDGVDKIYDKADEIEESGKERIEYVKDKARMARQDVDSYIRKNPERSVLIAAGVGAVVGALVAAAFMRRKN
jgi:ElaB/YqjD/DUF883 family membrane-anchored ribosome-binding protein